MKQQIQLSLEADTIRKLRERGVNISELVDNVLKYVVKQESLTAEEITMSFLLDERDRLLSNIKRTEETKERIQKLLEQTNGKIKKQEIVIAEVRKSERIAALMRQLNERIVTLNFDFEQIRTSPELPLLINEGVPVSEAWLKRHIARIELLGR